MLTFQTGALHEWPSGWCRGTSPCVVAELSCGTGHSSRGELARWQPACRGGQWAARGASRDMRAAILRNGSAPTGKGAAILRTGCVPTGKQAAIFRARRPPPSKGAATGFALPSKGGAILQAVRGGKGAGILRAGRAAPSKWTSILRASFAPPSRWAAIFRTGASCGRLARWQQPACL